MSEIIIFSGTTEGKLISEALSANGIYHIVCVATEFGKVVMQENEYADIYSRRLDEKQIESFVLKQQAKIIIDATHPYARLVTENLKKTAEKCSIEYIRVIREKTAYDYQNFKDSFECVKALKNVTGNILLTTGSKDLEIFSEDESIRDRLFVRVIPAVESLKKCEELHINSKQIIAMVGPFSKQINEAIIKQYDIRTLVTKDGGKSGGFYEKLQACNDLGINVYVIGREAESGYSITEVLDRFNIKLKRKVTLVGVGCGDNKHQSIAAKEIIDKADLIVGAKRMIEPYQGIKQIKELYLADEIDAYLNTLANDFSIRNIAVLFSGDTGFFSGATKLYERLCDRDDYKIEIECGISSFSYFAALINVDYSNARLLSLHGKAGDMNALAKVIDSVETNEKTFVIMSGPEDVVLIGRALIKNKLSEVEIVLGYNLSYENQKIITISPSECESIKEKGLYIAMLRNDKAFCRPQMILIDDEEFIKDKVPMTKAEIRHMVVQKLKLNSGAIIFDIGAGTGSVSIEIASQYRDSYVYAFEKKEAAVELINKNIAKFAMDNVEVIKGSAPQCLYDFEVVPTHAFIGGSSGNIIEIVNWLTEVNPDIRIVATAISIESIAMLNELVKIHSDRHAELVCVSIAKGKRVADYSLLEGMNPVYIFSMGGKNV